MSNVPGSDVPGAVERRLLERGRAYALGLRVVVIGLSSAVALVFAAIPDRPVTAAVVAGFDAWSLLYAYGMIRGPARARRLLPVADVAVVCAICLCQPWTVASDPRGGATWVLIAVNMVVVTYAWQIGTPLLAGATLAIAGLYYWGTTLADPGGWLVSWSIAPWTVAEAALSWALYRFVRGAARSADRTVDRAADLRRAAGIAAARRTDEREYLAALHDTAAATLLMVGSGVVERPEPWLAEQARRDLRELHTTGGGTDLVSLLREAARTSGVRVLWQVPPTLPLPAADAVSLSRCAREALTNVARHAGTGEATVRVRDDDTRVTVEITDTGRGFDPAGIPDSRYGVRGSLVERMVRIGGRARIDSSPGAGTTVTLECPRPASGDPAASDDREVIAASFQRGLRRAVVVLCLGILCLLDLPHLVGSVYAYAPLWPQVVAWCGLVAITVYGRRPAVSVPLVFAVSVLATSSVLPPYLLGPAHWSEGDAGWPIVLLLLSARVPVLAAVLAAQYLITFGQAVWAGQAALSVAGAVSATWAVLAYQLAVAMIAAVLRGISASSARAVAAAERLRTSEEVARQLHADRAVRVEGLAASVVPLLEGLSSGSLDPSSAAVRRACAAEAARMRLLFADLSDIFAHELRACIEQAERNGVTVAYAECGTRPELPPLTRRLLIEPAVAALATARGRARLTVAATAGSVTVSIIAVCAPPVRTADTGGVRHSVLATGDRLWIEAAWQAAP